MTISRTRTWTGGAISRAVTSAGTLSIATASNKFPSGTPANTGTIAAMGLAGQLGPVARRRHNGQPGGNAVAVLSRRGAILSAVASTRPTPASSPAPSWPVWATCWRGTARSR
jgi:hypothetical protein